MSPHTSLAELGMDSMMAVEIKQTLEREFEIFLTAQDIRSLNFAKLQEMAKKDAGACKKRAGDGGDGGEILTGLKLLVRLVGNTDVNPETCCKLATKDEADRAEVFILPGIEGIATVFNDLAPKIKPPACCLQMGSDSESQESVTVMADRMLPVNFFFIIL